MGLEQLDANKLIGPQPDVETIETWADRNGITYDTARFWAMRGAAYLKARQAPMVISATHRHLL
ncbi:DNA-binding protein [Pseudomonas sp. G34]|uniref:DNA-binding protein n=1 Tax=Pseudomonas sp. G34 TaxID=3059083 RepID=UPI00280A0E4A|nr:DNA-binding protein [Pseudomonas sp. G34]MDQ7986057.1 DNA-binding protein [Pseudomonas sp. G34]